MAVTKKRKKTSSRKKGRSATRFGLEILALCILLVVAAYVGNWGKSSPQPARPAAVKTEKANQHKTARILTEKKQEAAKKSASQQTAQASGKGEGTLDRTEYRLSYAADGDSFELEDAQKRKRSVRLYGIDAPEGGQAFGNKSRNHLLSLIKGQKLQLRTMYTDNYQRAVAIVYISRNGKADELSINQRQIQAGMAWVYDYFCTSAECNTWKLEEAMAQKQKLGLWRDSNPVPPWQWRRANPR